MVLVLAQTQSFQLNGLKHPDARHWVHMDRHWILNVKYQDNLFKSKQTVGLPVESKTIDQKAVVSEAIQNIQT